MQTSGIPAPRLSTTGFGDTKPLAANTAETGPEPAGRAGEEVRAELAPHYKNSPNAESSRSGSTVDSIDSTPLATRDTRVGWMKSTTVTLSS